MSKWGHVSFGEGRRSSKGMGLAKKKSDKTIEKRYLEKEEETGEETAYRLGKLSEWVAQIQEISHNFYWLNHKTSAVIKKKHLPP